MTRGGNVSYQHTCVSHACSTLPRQSFPSLVENLPFLDSGSCVITRRHELPPSWCAPSTKTVANSLPISTWHGHSRPILLASRRSGPFPRRGSIHGPATLVDSGDHAVGTVDRVVCAGRTRSKSLRRHSPRPLFHPAAPSPFPEDLALPSPAPGSETGESVAPAPKPQEKEKKKLEGRIDEPTATKSDQAKDERKPDGPAVRKDHSLLRVDDHVVLTQGPAGSSERPPGAPTPVSESGGAAGGSDIPALPSIGFRWGSSRSPSQSTCRRRRISTSSRKRR